MKYCSVYFRDDGIYVICLGTDKVAGYNVACEPVERLAPDAPPHDVGAAVLRVLAAAGRMLSDGEGLVPETFQRVLGFKSWGRFEKGARFCEIEFDGVSVAVTPMEPFHGGFGGIPNQTATCRLDAALVGQTLFERLKFCKARGTKSKGSAPKSSRREPPVPFGYKSAWLAIRNDDLQAVVSALELINPRPATWAAGVVYPYDQHIFVSPAVAGWTFVVGLGLPEAGDQDRALPKFIPFLETLSGKLGHVQCFGTHRVSDYHAWAKAERGKLTRAYAFAGSIGEVLINVGAATPEERELGFSFYERSMDESDRCSPDESNVLELAEKWSINPMVLDGYEDDELGAGPGVVADGYMGYRLPESGVK